jgi:3-keto-5-aminohexanoate cleavage enzyme
MRALAEGFKRFSVVPEFEIYDMGHVDNLRKLIKEGLVTSPFHCQFVLGVVGALAGDLSALVYLSEHLPPQSTWGVAGIGRFELPLAVHAIVMGGHVRVGLEDNIYYDKGKPAESNAQLVKRIARIAAEVSRPVATPDEARQMLGLS